MEFYVVLIKNNGEIIHNVFATSHRDLICKYISQEDNLNKTYFKATFSPSGSFRLDDVDNYHLIINETYIPEWFNDDLKGKTINNLKEIINSMIIKGNKKLLLHEGVILNKNTYVAEIKNSIVFAMYDNARIKLLDVSTEVKQMTDECIIDKMCDGTKVCEMWGFALIKEMHDYSKVLKMWGQSKILKMYDQSLICILKGDANIEEMRDESQADRLKHMSKVMEMHDHSQIEELWDWAIVEKMFDSSRIHYMNDESKVFEMWGNSTIEYMGNNTIIGKLYENSVVRKLENMARILEKELNK